MGSLQDDQQREQVRQRYAEIGAQEQGGCCCGGGSSCCGNGQEEIDSASLAMGYSIDELLNVPDGADLGLGCGNPQAIAGLKSGEVVLDLGSGGGLDCFLAARQVGEQGLVIGVDMTPEMISRARLNANVGDFHNVEFRLGEIENLPVADNSVDVIMSNCVINLSPEKQRVFNESFRVLKPGGRLAVSDVVAIAEIPEEFRSNPELYAGCVGGASLVSDLQTMLVASGFKNIVIDVKEESAEFIGEWAPHRPITDYIRSAYIQAVKPEK
jgi:SAM-dependent methyltransferase